MSAKLYVGNLSFATTELDLQDLFGQVGNVVDVKIIQDKNTSQDDKDRFMRALDFIKGPEKDAALVQLLTQ